MQIAARYCELHVIKTTDMTSSIPSNPSEKLAGPVLIEVLKTTLARGVPLTLRAKGSSMHPFIKDGDLITVSPLKAHSPGLGDVVAFVQREAEKLVIHRMIRIKADAHFMKGDATTGVDSPVPRANVLGLVTRIQRDHKRVLIGLGPEKFIIAMLARKGLVNPLVRIGARLLRLIRTLTVILSIPLKMHLNQRRQKAMM